MKLTEVGCSSHHGKEILKFSKSFLAEIEELKSKGYQPISAKVNFVVYWQKDGEEKEILVVLPELEFEKTNEQITQKLA